MVTKFGMIQWRDFDKFNFKLLSKTLEKLFLRCRETHFGRRGGLMENEKLDGVYSMIWHLWRIKWACCAILDGYVL